MYLSDGIADLTFIKNFVINKKVDIKAEITKKRSGNTFELFLSFDKSTWFFYSYARGILNVLSSNQAFNDAIQTMDIDERKQKNSIGEKSFMYMITPQSKLNRFTKKFGLTQIKSGIPAAGQEISKIEETNEPE